MSANAHAVRVGLTRGWIEFLQSIKSAQDQGFYVFTSFLILGYVFINRHDQVAGTDLLMPSVAMPSLLGGLVAFGMIIGPAYALAMQREDGTLLRSLAAPRGLVGYVTGQVVSNAAGLVPSLATILVPALFLFDGLMQAGARGWVTLVWVIALGLLATLPLGIIIGSLVKGVQKVGTWGMLPFATLTGISGIFFPIDGLWPWVRVIAQGFPLYWIGLGMRSAFLPEAAAAYEIAGSWRTPQTVAVLVAWAAAGLAVTPAVLRRMAQRQSGSQVEAARDQALQWVH